MGKSRKFWVFLPMKSSLLISLLITDIFGCAQSFEYLPKSPEGETVIHTYYTLSYVEAHEQSQWVAYELTGENAAGGVERTNNFKKDPLVSTGSASPDDYKNSGYDRGHLAPAGDMAFSELAMKESFYMSNMSPQHPSFNRGIWKKLEEQVSTWAVECGSIYVVTGPVLASSLGAITVNRITVPGYYYKVVLDYAAPGIKAIALVLPNKMGEKQLSEYVVSIDHVEKITRIDFFPALPDSLENALEEKISIAGWSFDPVKFSSANNSTPATQCLGNTKAGERCKNKTTNQNGFCHVHQSQTGSDPGPVPEKKASSTQCTATTKAGNRCKRMTTYENGRCWQHQ